jgi:hypothetical protein
MGSYCSIAWRWFSDLFNKNEIFYLIENDDIEGLKNLLKNDNSQINTQDFSGFTPLHRAIERNHYTSARLLLQYGADVNFFFYFLKKYTIQTYPTNLYFTKIPGQTAYEMSKHHLFFTRMIEAKIKNIHFPELNYFLEGYSLQPKPLIFLSLIGIPLAVSYLSYSW